MTKKIVDETIIKCIYCGEGICISGPNHANLDWFSHDLVTLHKEALCTNCKQTTNADTVVEVSTTTRIYYARNAYTITEIAQKFVLVVKSALDLALHDKANFSADKPTIVLTGTDQQKIKSALRIKIIQEKQSSTKSKSGSTAVGSIALGSVSSPGGFYIGNNNSLTISKNGIGLTIAVFGSNILIQDSP